MSGFWMCRGEGTMKIGVGCEGIVEGLEGEI